MFYYNGDVADPAVLKSFIEFALEKLKRIDVLVNNACRGNKGILSGLTYEEFDYTLSIGLKAPYELSRLCKDELKRCFRRKALEKMNFQWTDHRLVGHDGTEYKNYWII